MTMKIDHLVVNVEARYQTDKAVIDSIRAAGFPYQPKWGKGTSGFSASNIWIGDAYFEMIRLLKEDGGGWKSEWVEQYNQGHRGLICLMFDVDDIDALYTRMAPFGMTAPEYLQFKWFFNLLTRTMPWRNAYLPFLESIPVQIGFQQMKDDKSRQMMAQYMVPNSRDNGIQGVRELVLECAYTDHDLATFSHVLGVPDINDGEAVFTLKGAQRLILRRAAEYRVIVTTECNNVQYQSRTCTVENINIRNASDADGL